MHAALGRHDEHIVHDRPSVTDLMHNSHAVLEKQEDEPDGGNMTVQSPRSNLSAPENHFGSSDLVLSQTPLLDNQVQGLIKLEDLPSLPDGPDLDLIAYELRHPARKVLADLYARNARLKARAMKAKRTSLDLEQTRSAEIEFPPSPSRELVPSTDAHELERSSVIFINEEPHDNASVSETQALEAEVHVAKKAAIKSTKDKQCTARAVAWDQSSLIDEDRVRARKQPPVEEISEYQKELMRRMRAMGLILSCRIHRRAANPTSAPTAAKENRGMVSATSQVPNKLLNNLMNAQLQPDNFAPGSVSPADPQHQNTSQPSVSVDAVREGDISRSAINAGKYQQHLREGGYVSASLQSQAVATSHAPDRVKGPVITDDEASGNQNVNDILGSWLDKTAKVDQKEIEAEVSEDVEMQDVKGREDATAETSPVANSGPLVQTPQSDVVMADLPPTSNQSHQMQQPWSYTVGASGTDTQPSNPTFRFDPKTAVTQGLLAMARGSPAVSDSPIDDDASLWTEEDDSAGAEDNDASTPKGTVTKPRAEYQRSYLLEQDELSNKQYSLARNLTGHPDVDEATSSYAPATTTVSAGVQDNGAGNTLMSIYEITDKAVQMPKGDLDRPKYLHLMAAWIDEEWATFPGNVTPSHPYVNENDDYTHTIDACRHILNKTPVAWPESMEDAHGKCLVMFWTLTLNATADKDNLRHKFDRLCRTLSLPAFEWTNNGDLIAEMRRTMDILNLLLGDFLLTRNQMAPLKAFCEKDHLLNGTHHFDNIGRAMYSTFVAVRDRWRSRANSELDSMDKGVAEARWNVKKWVFNLRTWMKYEDKLIEWSKSGS
ncbi:uncharacterized protein PV09_04163 [Verruconis gallopava]|uniref:Uncharacterized protein n=1 Tax=Verruconis gallopava TaxID=253628 RepID=A0A0D2AF02_9PEZI|nr:uncharacterized protein PV09_04163 [Verruconis gallopava]KIW05005.1 hypothetical protein PV09_04163 [Verruconis gallopava]